MLWIPAGIRVVWMTRIRWNGTQGMAKVLARIILVFIGLALAGCDAPEAKHSSQVVARVNHEEITVHQLNSFLAHTGIKTWKTPREASRDALETLIEQELLVQQAVREDLERDPQIMLAVEDAKRRVLALAYLERKVLPKTPPTSEDIQAFYHKHPELFSQRKLYRLQAFAMPADRFDDGLKRLLDPAQTPQETAHLLQARNIDYQTEWLQWSAEQAPLELLPRLAVMEPGDIAAVQRGKTLLLLQLEAALLAPLDEAKAKPAIEAYLSSARNGEASRIHLSRLWRAAEIHYQGEFAGYESETTQQLGAGQNDVTSSGGRHLQKGIDGL